jgi:hypothetical protein
VVDVARDAAREHAEEGDREGGGRGNGARPERRDQETGAGGDFQRRARVPQPPAPLARARDAQEQRPPPGEETPASNATAQKCRSALTWNSGTGAFAIVGTRGTTKRAAWRGWDPAPTPASTGGRNWQIGIDADPGVRHGAGKVEVPRQEGEQGAEAHGNRQGHQRENAHKGFIRSTSPIAMIHKGVSDYHRHWSTDVGTRPFDGLFRGLDQETECMGSHLPLSVLEKQDTRHRGSSLFQLSLVHSG